jgi:hypothetical protein
LRAQVRWINGFSLFPGTRRAVDKIDRIFYADLSGHYQIGDSVQVFAGVNNVFDEQPPIVGFFAGGDPNVSPSTFDVIGRRFFAGLKLIFWFDGLSDAYVFEELKVLEMAAVTGLIQVSLIRWEMTGQDEAHLHGIPVTADSFGEFTQWAAEAGIDSI